MSTFQTVGTPGLWLGFLALVLAMLAIDLGVFHRKAHEVTLKEAAIWSAVWVSISALFGVGVYFWFGSDIALQYATGYLLEKALAVDNIFVFVLVFSTFAIPPIYQHRVLFWGIISALGMRAAFIFMGGAFVQQFHWAIYVFGGILILTGIKLLFQRDEAPDVTKNPVVRFFLKLFPSTSELSGAQFFVKKDGRRFATPLLLALVAIEVADVIFAIDSIPAIFAITQDPFIVFTSNIFAILGLRSMYFLLAGVIDKFHYLKVGLSLVLVFVGTKMALTDVFHLPIAISLAVIAVILAASIVISLLRPAAPHPSPKRDPSRSGA